MSIQQDRLREILAEADAIKAKTRPTADDIARHMALVEEGEGLRTLLEQADRMDSVAEWGRKSAGMIPIAGRVEGFAPAGTAIVERKGNKLWVNDDGDMLLDERTLRVIGDPAYKSAQSRYLRYGREGLKDVELKVLQEGADTSGGFLVHDEMLARLISKEPAPTNVAARVTRLQTTSDALSVPSVDYATDNTYTSGMRVTWTGEIPASATVHRVTQPVFGQRRIPIWEAMMSLPVTNSMIEDANFPLINWCTQKFGETIDLLYDNMVINGDGGFQPAGILRNPDGTNEPSVVNSGAASTLTADGLVDLGFALPEQYDANAVMVFNKTNTGKAIAKLKDGDGRYLWGSGLQDSGLMVPTIRGRELLGYPVMLNAFMPNVTTDTYPIIFGDLRGYYLVTRIAFSIQVLRELYAETGQQVLLGRVRFGGAVIEPWRLKIQKCSV